MNIVKKFYIYLKFRSKKFAHLGEQVDYKHLSSRFIQPANISIGCFSKVGEGAYLDGSGGIEIGNCSIIGPNATIITSNHNYDNDAFLPYDNTMIRKKVTIMDYSWLGRNVTVLPGVTIGMASVVSAGSVVTKNVEDFCIVRGNPAQVVKQRDIDKTKLLISQKKCVADPKVNLQMDKIWK